VYNVAFEALKAEIGVLLEMLGTQAQDRYELYIQLKEKLNEYRAFGMPVPDDLVQLEAALDSEFVAARKSAEHAQREQRYRDGKHTVAKRLKMTSFR
jgi:hypothetical protein